MAYQIDTDLLLATAIQAATNHSAFVTFSVELKRASLTPCPTIHIPRSDSPDNPVTTGYFALCSLASSLQAGLLRAPASYASQAEQFVFDVLPFVRSWVTYFVNHFILPSLDSEGDLTVVSSNVLRELVDNETTPLRIIREVASMKTPSTNRLFLPRMLCDLLFSTERIPASENRRKIQLLCCEGLSFIDKMKKEIPLARDQVLDTLRTDAKTFINLLHATVIENLVDLDNTPPEFISRCLITIYLFYETLGHFLSPHADVFWPELARMKHTQWICRAILGATSPRVMKLSQEDLPISQETPVPLFAAIIHLITASLEQLSLITQRLGHPQVQIILESKALLYLLRYCRTFSLRRSNSVDRQYRLLYSIELPALLTCMTPYLVYHSVLLPAVRLRNAMQREVEGIGFAYHPEIRRAWKLYSERLAYLERVRKSQNSRPTLCEFPGCLNSEKRSHRMVCAGCNLYYYCSRPCQKADWKAHRSKCAERRKDQQTTFLGWTSTQDSWFLGCVVQDMLNTDNNMDMLGTPRYIDFTEDDSELKIQWNCESAGQQKMVRELQGHDRDGLLVVWKLPRGVDQEGQLDGMMRIDTKVVKREKTFILHNRDLEDRNIMLYK